VALLGDVVIRTAPVSLQRCDTRGRFLRETLRAFAKPRPLDWFASTVRIIASATVSWFRGDDEQIDFVQKAARDPIGNDPRKPAERIATAITSSRRCVAAALSGSRCLCYL
jgi:hypothetical protein